MDVERNWAGNIDYSAVALHRPRSLDELGAIVVAEPKVRALGSRHSFNALADTDGALISLAEMPRLIDIDTSAQTVTIDGGIRYGDLAAHLHDCGWALANLASLPHISVAGACATATHGSGAANGNLATSVRGQQLMTASGDLVDISADTDRELLEATTVGLGAFGIVTRMTLAIMPTYEVRQTVYHGLPMSVALDDLEAIMADGYSVSLFTTWREAHIEQLWRKRLVSKGAASPGDAGTNFGAVAATVNVHPVIELSADPCTEQMDVAGPWHERLPHFRMGFTPSSGDELQSELFVARADAPEVMRRLVALGGELAPILKISEVRSIVADDLWLSTCHRRDSVAFHFTWVPSWSEVQPLLARLEAELEPFSARPHWGKLSTMDAATVRSRYEKFDDFAGLVREWDPDGKFRNAFLDDLLDG